MTLSFAIAHRAGNDLAELRAAEDAGVGPVEADVWLYRGRLEVRHFKIMGPLQLLWDRWKVARGWLPRLQLAELLCAVRPGVEPMLGLKGADPRTADAVLYVAQQLFPDGSFTVCSQQWQMLNVF